MQGSFSHHPTSSTLSGNHESLRDPLLIFLHEKPPFDPDRDAALFEDLVLSYRNIADRFVKNHPPPQLPKPPCTSKNPQENFLSLNFDTLTWGSQEELLIEMVVTLFERFNLLKECSINEKHLQRFIWNLREEYLPNSYHGFLHALDVTQFCAYLLDHGGLIRHLEPFDISCLLLTALGHDVGHPGGHGSFSGSLKTSSGEIIQGHTLEECHLKLLFSLLTEKEAGLAKHWSSNQLSRFKQMAAGAVAATDMNNHLVALAHFDKIFRHIPTEEHQSLPRRRFLIQLAIKCADVSNVARPTATALKWTHALASESKNCDYCELDFDASKIQHAQEAFINFIAKPLFGALYLVLPQTSECLWNLHKNLEYWKQVET